jgi:predicted RNase H-like nuclease (RuvC/YqgF family)
MDILRSITSLGILNTKINMEAELKGRIQRLQIEVNKLNEEIEKLKHYKNSAGNYLCELAESDFTEKHWDNRKSKNNEWFDYNRAKARIIEGMLYEEVARELGSITKCWAGDNNGMVAGTRNDKRNCRCRACIALNKLNYLTHRKEKPEWMSDSTWNMNRD